jgi:NADH dehydrogenase
VADLGWLKLSGVLAWWAWLLVHILFLIGFRNRAAVLFEWAWSFFSYDRGARLITGPLRRDAKAPTSGASLSPAAPAGANGANLASQPTVMKN